MCVFCKTQHSFTLYLSILYFSLVLHRSTVEVQIRILLKDKYLSWKQQSSQNVNTGIHTLISWTMRFGFLILENQLASQDMVLIRSKLSITAYLFLVFYRSTSLQSLSFLKNIKTFLCKCKLVNNCIISSKKQPYNHDRFSKISRASTALQSRLFLKNIKNFLCK